jgi:hypothetical protein
MSTDPRLLALRVLRAEVNRKLAERLEPVRAALALIERAEGDIAAGWPEAALDCLGRTRRLLERCTQRDRR